MQVTENPNTPKQKVHCTYGSALHLIKTGVRICAAGAVVRPAAGSPPISAQDIAGICLLTVAIARVMFICSWKMNEETLHGLTCQQFVKYGLMREGNKIISRWRL